jgi:hypothetical protein
VKNVKIYFTSGSEMGFGVAEQQLQNFLNPINGTFIQITLDATKHLLNITAIERIEIS